MLRYEDSYRLCNASLMTGLFVLNFVSINSRVLGMISGGSKRHPVPFFFFADFPLMVTSASSNFVRESMSLPFK